MKDDQTTAEAFAKSWTHLPTGSIYTFEQFEDWFAPITQKDIEGKSVLELGCGNGSLLVHLTKWNPSQITGVDLGPSTEAALKNMRQTGYRNYSIIRADLTEFSGSTFDVVYSIGVLHHLKHPTKGFESLIANAKPGGRFHCWVYAREGNDIIIRIVDPIRRITSRLPWILTKYLIAAPLAALYFVYAKSLQKMRAIKSLHQAPLFEYSLWIAQRPFSFFHHVAFDQLVAPRTAYIDKPTVQSWLTHPGVAPESSYIVFRNGNSWKFGGRVR
ncbi:MAG: class I SAM-dependent methyltransferase [Verrucomicrobiota bacterium]